MILYAITLLVKFGETEVSYSFFPIEAYLSSDNGLVNSYCSFFFCNDKYLSFITYRCIFLWRLDDRLIDRMFSSSLKR